MGQKFIFEKNFGDDKIVEVVLRQEDSGHSVMIDFKLMDKDRRYVEFNYSEDRQKLIGLRDQLILDFNDMNLEASTDNISANNETWQLSSAEKKIDGDRITALAKQTIERAGFSKSFVRQVNAPRTSTVQQTL